MIWFTSDTHFFHSAVIRYSSRPQFNESDYHEVDGKMTWVSEEIKRARTIEMNEMLISKWNSVVSPKDTVYHLGDFAFASNKLIEEVAAKLNGKIHLILGNHDKHLRKKPVNCFASIKENHELKIDGKSIYLAHFPHRSWEKSSHGSWHLFGHAHGNAEPLGKSFDVGVDCWNYRPISYDEVVQKMLSI